MLDIQTIAAGDADFWSRVDALATSDAAERADVREAAESICRDVRERGDAAVLEYTRRFDRRDDLAGVAELRLSPEAMAQAFESLDAAARDTLVRTHERLVRFAEQQVATSWRITDDIGCELGEQITPLDRAGLYVPGGKAAYPSSVLMNAIPAMVAGVERRVMVVPARDGEVNPLVLAAASLAGVSEVWRIGGAQAVAALAYGTQTIGQVDKVVGPGNAFVAAAKRQVFGQVGIDSIAGPSEILVVADAQNDPSWIAADLLSQAEHDEAAQSILITDDADFADAVESAVQAMLPQLKRAAVAGQSWADNGAIITVPSMDEMPTLANRIAAEHLELALDDAADRSGKIRHAGAMFLGRYTPEAIGDYVAGPNHVLPTARTARFSSGLGVADFMKRTTIVACDADGFAAIAPSGVALADAEGLGAHALSMRIRMNR